MSPAPTPRVKVCCIADAEEARLAIDAGADALGLVSAMPSGPGVIPEHTIAELARLVPPPIATFLLTSLQEVEAVIAQHRRCRTGVIQLVDRLAHGSHSDLRAALPGVAIVQVIHVTGPEALDEALAVAPEVDALLLDSGNPTLVTKALGGTGRVHDWGLSARIREAVHVPVFLAGGLCPENVRRALDEVHPWGLDLCSGVRTGGRLDPAKLDRFMAAAKPRPS